MNFFISSAYAQAASGGSTGGEAGGMISWVFLIGFMVIFYFLILRPQQKRNKDHKSLLGNLQKGDEVVTSGGIVGKVAKVTDEFVVLSITDDVQLKFQKAAIIATLPKGTLKALDEQ